MFQVDGMSCGHCVASVTRALQALDPAAKITVDLAAGRVAFLGEASPTAVVAALDEAGYAARPIGPASTPAAGAQA